MEIKIYEQLPKEAIEIRTEVFIKEQGFKEEFDGIDKISKHLVMFDDNIPVAVLRFYYDNVKKSYILGRIAVRKSYRGKNLGSEIIEFAQNKIKNNGGKTVSLLAQVKAEKFYEKLGFKSCGEIVYDEYCPHIWMKKEMEAGDD